MTIRVTCVDLSALPNMHYWLKAREHVQVVRDRTVSFETVPDARLNRFILVRIDE